MKSFLTSLDFDAALVSKISECILSTKYLPRPKSVLNKIICDADTYHFGTDLFKQTDLLMRKETEQRTGKPIEHRINGSIHLLKNHRFYTDYCNELLLTGKQHNILWLQSQVDPE